MLSLEDVYILSEGWNKGTPPLHKRKPKAGGIGKGIIPPIDLYLYIFLSYYDRTNNRVINQREPAFLVLHKIWVVVVEGTPHGLKA